MADNVQGITAIVAYLVPVIVIAVIILQFSFFFKNKKRMEEYTRIFDKDKSWYITHDEETEFVSGIEGGGNDVFASIKKSINEYLKNNSGSVIDFSLLKDAVDRHCDSVENEIETLTPVPLYCGLAGTMAGVIIGLFSLLYTGSISALLSYGQGNIGAAANGVNDLLTGVAWAMSASIVGIILTTSSSLLFKKCKLQGEAGKNTFLAWLQSKLLPELPSDTSQALSSLVTNLNSFNSTFAKNTTGLGSALDKVNESYGIQAEIIKAVQDMDVMKMAQANVSVLKELKDCTGKLELFNRYLNDVQGYTDAIHKFTARFDQESNRLHVLEEIQQFFMRHKAEIAKDVGETDVALNDALKELKDSANSNIEELNKSFIKQSQGFEEIIKEEKEEFGQLIDDLKTKFSFQLEQIPMLEKRLATISQVPAKLDELISRIEDSNRKLSTGLISVIEKKSSHPQDCNVNEITTPDKAYLQIPEWIKISILVAVAVISITCVANMIHNIWVKPEKDAGVINSVFLKQQKANEDAIERLVKVNEALIISTQRDTLSK